MSVRLDPLSLLPAGLIADASRRGAQGIRISLAAAPKTPVVARRAPGLRSRKANRQATFWAGPAELRPPATDVLRGLDYVVVDVETTGGSMARGHRITEVCAVRVGGDGRRLGEFTSLINPLRAIPPSIMALTRITHEMVQRAPLFEEIAVTLADFLEGAVFVAHNAPFDWRFVSAELERAAVPVPYARVLCTVRLARHVVPEIPRRSLDALSYFFGIRNEARHRAFGDARATARIFRRLLDRVDERDVLEWGQLESLLRRRAPRRRKRTAMPAPMEDA